MKQWMMIILAAIMMTGCASPGIEDTGQERRAYTINPSQTITENRMIVLTGEAIDRLIVMSHEDFERIKSLIEGGSAQSMGVWNIHVSAEVKRDKHQRQEADARADISPEVSVMP